MMDWLLNANAYTHTIAALLLLGRLGDVLSTRLISPTLRLETNVVARRLGWRFAWLSLLLALVPYYSLAIGIAALAVSLLVTAANLSRGWMFSALGELDADRLLLSIAAKTRLRTALGFVLSGALFMVTAGLVLVWLSGSAELPSYWFGVGIVVYGVAIAIHGGGFVVRLFRRAHSGAPAA
jgi:hypothetical protein